MSRRWLSLCFTLLLAALVVPRAYASADRVSFFHDISIGDTEEVDDAVCILCSIHVDGKVNGDAVAILGAIHLNGEIKGDVVSILGEAALKGQSRIGGDCVVMGGPIRRGESATIGGDTVDFPLFLVLMPFFFAGLVIYGIVALIRSRKYAAYPMPPPPPPVR
jgi:hypothetical protein